MRCPAPVPVAAVLLAFATHAGAEVRLLAEVGAGAGWEANVDHAPAGEEQGAGWGEAWAAVGGALAATDDLELYLDLWYDHGQYPDRASYDSDAIRAEAGVLWFASRSIAVRLAPRAGLVLGADDATSYRFAGGDASLRWAPWRVVAFRVSYRFSALVTRDEMWSERQHRGTAAIELRAWDVLRARAGLAVQRSGGTLAPDPPLELASDALLPFASMTVDLGAGFFADVALTWARVSQQTGVYVAPALAGGLGWRLDLPLATRDRAGPG